MKKITDWSNKLLLSLSIFIIPAFVFATWSTIVTFNSFNWWAMFCVMIICVFISASACGILLARLFENKNKNKFLRDYHIDQNKIKETLLESVYISRWTKNKEALVAVLTPEESMQIVEDILEDLDKNGFEIRKKF